MFDYSYLFWLFLLQLQAMNFSKLLCDLLVCVMKITEKLFAFEIIMQQFTTESLANSSKIDIARFKDD